ncbi:MAG: DoxX family membrane protein [Dehalococcoidia bacterium]|nr:DoxX family membrane protein [Dehalococcoidia bacterium]
MAPLWLLARLYLGWQWLHSGWSKVTGDGWLNQGGVALQGYWEAAVRVPEEGRPTITYDWYRDFLQYMLDHEWYEWFAVVIATGEVIVGLMLIAGAFTAIAAFFGAFMNFNFLLAGSASTNPVLFVLALLLMGAWKTAGHIGVDRWLLPALGAPWSPGGLFRREAQPHRG